MKTTLLIYEITLGKIVNFITHFKVTIPSVMSLFAAKRMRDKDDSSQSGDIGSLPTQAPQQQNHSKNYPPSICAVAKQYYYTHT